MTVTQGLIIVAVCAIGATVCAVQVRRALREPLERDRIAADAKALAELPAADSEPGINLALQDECELLWSIPADKTCFDRLPEAVRDEQRKGETP